MIMATKVIGVCVCSKRLELYIHRIEGSIIISYYYPKLIFSYNHVLLTSKSYLQWNIFQDYANIKSDFNTLQELEKHLLMLINF